MEKIVVGFLGCGNIGCGVYKLLETYGAQIEENEGVGFEVRKILVRSLNKSRAWAIPSTLLTDRPEDVLDDRFVEACHMLECTQYMLDLLTIGSPEERTELVSDMMKDNKITLLQERLREIKEETNEQA